MKSHGDEVADFYDSDSNHTVISLNSALKTNENYYPQVF